MSFSLHTLTSNPGARREGKYIGRGLGSKGTYSGRGTKGQKARSGGRAGLRLKGLRKIMLSLPKQRGFSPRPKPLVSVVNVQTIASHFKSGDVVSLQTLKANGCVSSDASSVKILGMGAIGVKVTVKECLLSESAKQKILEAGGTIA